MEAIADAAAMVLLPRVDQDGSGAEGLGLCLLEAAARGIPTIGCRTGGVEEAIGPGLLLDDPENPNLPRVEAFLSDPEHGPRARSWLQDTHGPARTVETLMAVMD